MKLFEIADKSRKELIEAIFAILDEIDEDADGEQNLIPYEGRAKETTMDPEKKQVFWTTHDREEEADRRTTTELSTLVADAIADKLRTAGFSGWEVIVRGRGGRSKPAKIKS